LVFLSNFSLASEFQYKNKNIDPNCILGSYNAKEVNLNKCNQHPEKIITKDISKGDFIGYQYTEKGVPGSVYYRYLGKINDDFVVHAGAIGGSASRLDFINYFKIKEDKLILTKKGPSGDRSNGGISNARIENNKILYDIANTPLLFMINFNYLEKRDNHPIIENLSDCAVCEFAKVHYYNDKITSVTLNEEVNTGNQCLNKLHAQYKRKNHLKLTLKQAETFAKLFLTKCAK